MSQDVIPLSPHALQEAIGIAQIIRDFCKGGIVPEPFGGSLDTADLAAMEIQKRYPSSI